MVLRLVLPLEGTGQWSVETKLGQSIVRLSLPPFRVVHPVALTAPVGNGLWASIPSQLARRCSTYAIW